MIKVRMNAYSEKEHRMLIRTSGEYSAECHYYYSFADNGTDAIYEYGKYYNDNEVIPVDVVKTVSNLDAEYINELLYGREIEIVSDAA